MTTKKAAGRAAKAPHQVTTMVNGQVVGTVAASGTIVEAAQELAASHGLRAFSIRLNGSVLKAPDANKALSNSAKTLECFAKDTRGNR